MTRDVSTTSPVTELTWNEVDFAGGVVRLSPARSKTKVGRLLPISTPIRLQARRSDRAPVEGGVAHRLPTRRCPRPPLSRLPPNRGSEPHQSRRAERVAMLFTGHKNVALRNL